jgi:hypothetical protein
MLGSSVSTDEVSSMGLSLAGLGLEDRIKINSDSNLSQSSRISNPQSAKGKAQGGGLTGQGGEKGSGTQGGGASAGQEDGQDGHPPSEPGLSFKNIWASILEDVLPLLQKYVWHTAGAEVVHLHQFSVAWKYTHADPEWGDMQVCRTMSCRGGGIMLQTA